MNFSLIICTYKRPESLKRLLDSVMKQILYPNEILVIDGSEDSQTQEVLKVNVYPQLRYFKVEEKDRGLTSQRNFGINNISEWSEIICFLDDDIQLTENYFKHLLETYQIFPDAVGVGGYILNDIEWKKGETLNKYEFEYDGWIRPLGSRNVLRKKLNLLSDKPPGVMPEFSNGLSISFLPPTGKIYPVEFFMGGVASYKTALFKKINFSEFFKGYGLYEDLDFCLRASKFGKLYVNTAAGLFHFHHQAGRPNKLKYGKMVVRNGWYVWRLKHPTPPIEAHIKWHAIVFLLTLVRIGNIFTTSKKKEAFTESAGRIIGWWSLILSKPENYRFKK